MPTEGMVRDEPRLTVVHPKAFPFRRRFLRLFIFPALVSLVGATLLIASGDLFVPFSRVVSLEGKMGSKAELFEDEEIKRILLKKHLRVRVTGSSSRELAIHDFDRYDFVFPSGQPAAELISNERNKNNQHMKKYRPFVSPIVLASYREYAETLREAGVATVQGGAGQGGAGQGDRLYYHLDMKKFLSLVAAGRRWDDLGIARHGTTNGNKVVVQTAGICSANSAATYLGLVAFVKNGDDVVRTPADAAALAGRIKPLIDGEGQPSSEILKKYGSPEGPGIFPIVVMYEHEYLAYQIGHQRRTGRTDPRRVLIYPAAHFLTQPELISLNAKADRLGELITRDPEIRRRMAELGFRVLDSTDSPTGGQLSQLLQRRGIPVPTVGRDSTRTVLPNVGLLEKMIKVVGEC